MTEKNEETYIIFRVVESFNTPEKFDAFMQTTLNDFDKKGYDCADPSLRSYYDHGVLVFKKR